MSEFFNIRGQFEKWKIGNKTAADAPMPECETANSLPMPESKIRIEEKPMPKSGITMESRGLDPESPGCLGILLGYKKVN